MVLLLLIITIHVIMDDIEDIVINTNTNNNTNNNNSSSSSSSNYVNPYYHVDRQFREQLLNPTEDNGIIRPLELKGKKIDILKLRQTVQYVLDGSPSDANDLKTLLREASKIYKYIPTRTELYYM